MSRSFVFLGKKFSRTPILRVGWDTTRYPGKAILGCTNRRSWMTSLPSPSVPRGPFPTRSPPCPSPHGVPTPGTAPIDLPDDGPECQDGDDHQSVDSDDSLRARWIIDSGTTFHIISERDAERAGMTAFPSPREYPSVRQTALRTRPITRTSCSWARIVHCPPTYSTTIPCCCRCANRASMMGSGFLNMPS